jgi:UDP-glucuronate decarboxylase
VNMGNPQETSILSLAKQIIRMTGSRSRVVFESLPGDDPTRRCPDISQAKKELGWEPGISLDEGLSKTIEYFKRVTLHKDMP